MTTGNREAKDSLIHIQGNAEPIVTIEPDGTVVIHKEGTAPEAARIFWDEMRKQGQPIYNQINSLRQQLKESHDREILLLSCLEGATLILENYPGVSVDVIPFKMSIEKSRKATEDK